MTKDNIPKSPLQYKRLGRELTLQFLFQNDLSKEEDISKKLNLFWMQAEASEEYGSDSKLFRKAKNFATKLITGVTANYEELDAKIVQYATGWTIDRMAVVDRNLLRIAIYEMLHLNDVPPIVSIDEAVTIAKEFSSDKAATFINGILNNIKNDLDRPARRPLN